MDEAVPVPVPYALSDIDLVALHPRGPFRLPMNGTDVGPRLIVETKDEHDWDASGREFGAALRSDRQHMGELPYIPAGARNVKFTMLRQQHYEVATGLFGSTEFDRLFVVHAIDATTREALRAELAAHRIYFITIREVLDDLLQWYGEHKRPAGLRQTMVGDMIHLLVGYYGLRKRESR